MNCGYHPKMPPFTAYVDLNSDGVVLTPGRVEGRAAGEILSLEWFFTQFRALPEVLEDDGMWKQFAAHIGR
jgi:hypothetical protein